MWTVIKRKESPPCATSQQHLENTLRTDTSPTRKERPWDAVIRAEKRQLRGDGVERRSQGLGQGIEFLSGMTRNSEVDSADLPLPANVRLMPNRVLRKVQTVKCDNGNRRRSPGNSPFPAEQPRSQGD